jgi:hypothetical protein
MSAAAGTGTAANEIIGLFPIWRAEIQSFEDVAVGGTLV